MRPSLLIRSASLVSVAILATACGGSSSSKGASPGTPTGTVSAGTTTPAGPTSVTTSSTTAVVVKGSKGKLVVASAGFTESSVLASMYAALLTKAGYTVSMKNVTNSELFESSLENGQVDVVPEYAATYADQLNTLVNGPKAASVASSNLQATMAALAPLATQKGVTALTPTQAVDQNAFAVSQTFATANNLKTLSDLGALGKPVTLAAGAECATRPFCVPGLKATYGINVSKIDKLGVDTIQSKNAVARGKDTLALVLTTDATVADAKLVILTDNKGLQNADNLVPIVNSKTLADDPDIATELNKLATVLTTADLAQLNKEVDSARQRPDDAATQYLKSKGLL